MADYISGDDIVLYVHDGSIYRPIACLENNSLNQTRNIIDVQTKCTPGVVERGAGSSSYDISCDGKYIDTTSVGEEVTKASHDYIKTLFDAGSLVTWKMDTGLADTDAYYGTAIISDLSLEAPAGDEFASFSATLSGSGAIVTTDPEGP